MFVNILLKLIGLSNMSVWSLINLWDGKILVRKLSYFVYHVIFIICIYDIILFICLNNDEILNKEEALTVSRCWNTQLLAVFFVVIVVGVVLFCFISLFVCFSVLSVVKGIWEVLTLKRLNIFIEYAFQKFCFPLIYKITTIGICI